MTPEDSILDKIIQDKQAEEIKQFSPGGLISSLLAQLSQKERDVLRRRFGLNGHKKETLEQIGKSFEITRERIRQIEVSTIKKLKTLPGLKEQLVAVDHIVTRLLEEHGGVMSEDHLVEKISPRLEADEQNRESTLFIIHQLLDKIKKVSGTNEFLSGWRLEVVDLNSVSKAIQEIHDLISERDKLITFEELIEAINERDLPGRYQNEFNHRSLTEGDIAAHIERVLETHLNLSARIDSNILDEWGLKSWKTITPKRMADKIYLVLRSNKEPLHFTEITDRINDLKFDSKTAYPATIHNELILDPRYVLVGRGIYALSEWGYQPGTVMDVIEEVLKKADGPLTKDEIVKAVLDKRIVKKSTIYLALTNKKKITKLSNGRYQLKENSSEVDTSK